MSVYSSVFLAILPLFALIFFGYFSKKTRLLHTTDAPVLNRFVLTVSLPAFIVHALLSHHLDIAYIRLPPAVWLTELVVILLAFGVGRLFKWTNPQVGTLMLLSTFGNTGYMGYPVTTALMPALMPATVIIDQVGVSTTLYPLAPALGGILGSASKSGEKNVVLKVFGSPIFLAMIVGLVLALVPQGWIIQNTGFHLAAHMFMQLLALVGAVTIPVVLVAVGLLLRPSTLAMHGQKAAVVGFLKLILMPILAFLIGHWIFRLPGYLLNVLVLECAMPPGATPTMFTGQFDMDASLAVACFFACTVAAAVTLPLMISFLR